MIRLQLATPAYIVRHPVGIQHQLLSVRFFRWIQLSPEHRCHRMHSNFLEQEPMYNGYLQLLHLWKNERRRSG